MRWMTGQRVMMLPFRLLTSLPSRCYRQRWSRQASHEVGQCRRVKGARTFRSTRSSSSNNERGCSESKNARRFNCPRNPNPSLRRSTRRPFPSHSLCITCPPTDISFRSDIPCVLLYRSVPARIILHITNPHAPYSLLPTCLLLLWVLAFA